MLYVFICTAERYDLRMLLPALLSAADVAPHLLGTAGLEIHPGGLRLDPNHPIAVRPLALCAGFIVSVLLGAYGAALIAARSRKHAEQNLAVAIGAIPSGIALFDRHDRLVIWNDRYAEQGGEAAATLKPGQHFRELVGAGLALGYYPDAVGRESAWLEERLVMRQGVLTGALEQRDGERWLRLQERRTPDGGIVSLSTDITELKLDAEHLADARDRAEAANRAKDEFLANMSHELRTPLNGVLTVAQVLAATRLDPRQRELVELIESSGRVLQQLLSDVLDLARIEAGGLELASEHFSPGALARDVAGLWRAEAAQKGLTFDLAIDPGAEAAVEGDPLRLRQIIGNLLSNAAKFTERGGVTLTLDREPSAPEMLRFTITDTGIGFSPEQAESLFDRFNQADGSIVRRFGGSGLGLSICRELAGRMGGEIIAQGVPGQGASFRLRVPLPTLAASELVPAEAARLEVAAPVARGESPGEAFRVLLAEDHPVNRRVVALILEPAGVDLTVVENGAEAVEAFRTGRYDAVLMDMQMPVMDGLAATRAIRALEQASGAQRTLLIMLTANVLPEQVAAALAAGADRHLGKPVTPTALIAALEAEPADGAAGSGDGPCSPSQTFA